ncbi:MAG: TonB-dependent receptor [Prevotellaceae bacterium]|jgi:TonB-linked SusC/RagA family outer membrane protein|nr:TonB-dependent receptor [Prevotellaceae bacterium]
MRKILYLFFLMLLPSALWAQRNISGKVTDSANGDPLAGVTVAVSGTSAATMTNIDGDFNISAAPDAVLTFSFVGYRQQTINVNSRNYINVALEEDVTILDEVVAIGYGTMKKSDLTGAVSQLSGGKLSESIVTNADQILQGRVAGVQVQSNSGAPGAANSIRIRGASSINNSNEPLYVIDGIPMSGAGTTTAGFNWGGGSNGQNIVNPLASIAPSDIVSIDVLKDASATAIYGSAGANGVIIVTTKRGSKDNMSVNYDGLTAVQTRAGKKLDLMNLQEFATYQKQLNSEGFLPNINQTYLDPSLLGEGTDWQDAVLRNAWMHSHNISMNGGNQSTQFAASLGYTGQDGIILNSNFERFTGRVSVDHQYNKWFKMGANLAYSRTGENIVNNDGINGIVMQASLMRPDVPVLDFDGNYATSDASDGSAIFNPVAMAKEQINNILRRRTSGNAYVQINFLKYLNYRTEFGVDASNNKQLGFKPNYNYGQFRNAMIMDRKDASTYWIWKNLVNYNQLFGSHNLNVMLGNETSRSQWDGTALLIDNLSSNDIHVIGKDGTFVSNDGWSGAISKVSFFGRGNYNYADRYLLTATIRADGSSRFGANNRWGYFPSFAAAWRISNEKFMESAQSWLSNLKLRLGYGQNGNDNIETYLYGSSMLAFPTVFGTGYRMEKNANPDLKWETSIQYNAGLDLVLFNGRVDFTVDAYYKTTKDLLLRPSVSPVLGGSLYQDIATAMQNIGKVENKGIDIALNTRNIDGKLFKWNTNIVFSLNRNKVLALDELNTPFTSSIQQMVFLGGYDDVSLITVGQPMGVFYGYQTDGLYKDAEDLRNSPRPEGKPIDRNSGVWIGDIKFKDLHQDGVINEKDKTIIGDPNPDFTFGFNNMFSVGNFDLNIGITGSVGGDIFNVARMKLEREQLTWDNQLASVLNRAQLGYLDGDNTKGSEADLDNSYLINASENPTLPRWSNTDGNDNNRMSDRWIEDGSYVRIQNIALTYNLPKSILEKLKLQAAKLYFNVQNVYTFTKYSGLDPEIGAFNQSVDMSNIDFGRYPAPRIFTFGVNFTF